MDFLYVKNLRIYAYHGVFDAEKELGQNFYLNVKVGYDMTQAALESDLDKSIHYGVLCQQLTDWMLEAKEDLIETVAYKLAAKIFSLYQYVQSVELELKKPEAPIKLPLDTCSVQINRQRHRAFIGLGSNLGDTQSNLEQVRQHMASKGLRIVKSSQEIVTKAWGNTNQPDFLNQVVEVETIDTPQELLNKLQKIEVEMGRVRKEHWGARTIDLDILFYDQQIIYTDNLIVPHPYISQREFVLESVCEIAPHWIHPVKKESMLELLEKIAMNK